MSGYEGTCVRCAGTGKTRGLLQAFTCPVCLGSGQVTPVTWKSEPIDVERIRLDAEDAALERAAQVAQESHSAIPGDAGECCSWKRHHDAIATALRALKRGGK